MLSKKFIICFLGIVLAGMAMTAFVNDNQKEQAVSPIEMPKVVPFDFNGDVRNLPPAVRGPKSLRPLVHPPLGDKVPPSNLDNSTVVKKTSEAEPLTAMPSPIQNFDGLSFNDICSGQPCTNRNPPDPNGDVGPNHYIQAINLAYGIFSKTGTLLAAFTEDQLFSSTGDNPCNGNSQGDPIVLYDTLADRWILTHIAFALDVNDQPIPPFYQCIAASKTDDPVTGGYFLYTIRMDPGTPGAPPVGALNDYPKFGLWTDCLYMAANDADSSDPNLPLIGVSFASFSRIDLYTGSPLTFALGFLPFPPNDVFTLIPSNLRGTPPPPGTPNYYVSESLFSFHFLVRKFSAGPNCGAGGSLSPPVFVSQQPYTLPFVPNSFIVPQPNTTTRLDAIDDRLMQKVQYRRIGTEESLWVTHNVGTSQNLVAMQWAQLDVTGGLVSTTPVQQQIYTPDNTLYRWMGSIAADKQGNAALGYSTSNGIVPNFPSIAYSGRLVSDPLNTLPQSETQLIAGLGSQSCTVPVVCNRWGDYTAMTVDPVDDCTFWYTNEYYKSPQDGASAFWSTRIGSFKFPGCNTQIIPPTVGKLFFPPIIRAGGTSLLTITLSNNNILPATLSADFVDKLPAGVTTVGAASTTCMFGAAVAGGNTLTLKKGALIPANGSCTVSVNVTALVPGKYDNIIPADTLKTSIGNNNIATSAILFVIQPCD